MFRYRLVIVVIAVVGCGLLASSTHKTDAQKSFRVLVFLAVDCPISQDYIGKLNKLHRSFSDKDIKLVGLFPGRETARDLKRFAQEYQVQFELTVDHNQEWAKKLQATVTPEAFVIDNDDHIYYQGAIDDWYYDLGHHRQQVVHHYLIDALDALGRGIRPDSVKTTAVGCLITIRN